VRRLGARRCRGVVAARAPRLGFNDIAIGAHTATPEQVAHLAEGAGAGLFRIPFDWHWVERTRGTYQDTAVYDRAYRDLLALGIRPIIMLSGSPEWAWPALTLCPSSCQVPPAPRWDSSWRAMAAELARRYPRAAAIEIWNEPNERAFWQPAADPARYTDLLHQAYDAIKAVRPAMRVIGAGVDGRQVAEGGSMEGTSFLDAVLRAGGGSYMDGIAIHPYVHFDQIGSLAGLVASLRAVRDANHDSRLSLWVTEIGLSTTGPRGISEAAQAGGLTRIYRILASERDVRAIVVHSLIEAPGNRGVAGPGYGVVRADLTPKPAYCSLRRLVGVRGRCE
jgi:hypothetical protein